MHGHKVQPLLENGEKRLNAKTFKDTTYYLRNKNTFPTKVPIRLLVPCKKLTTPNKATLDLKKFF